MGLALIWVETLAAVLAAVGFMTALASHRYRRWSQRLLAILFALGFFAAALTVTYNVAWMNRHGLAVSGKIWLAGTWTAAYAVGSLVVLVCGLRRSGDGIPVARDWPLGRLAAAAGAALVLGGITFTNLDLAAKQQLAAIRAEGEARAAALAPRPLSDKDNAAPLYRQASETLHVDGPTVLRIGKWLSQRTKFDPNDSEAAAVLQGREPGMALLRRAAGMPGCRFDQGYSTSLLGPGTLEEADRMMKALYLLDLDARVRAGKGETRAALDDVTALFGASRQIDEPMLMMLILAIDIEGRGFNTLEYILAKTTPTADDLAQVRSVDISYQRSFWRCIQMDEAFGVPSYFALQSDGTMAHATPMRFAGFSSTSAYRVFFLADDLAGYSRVMQHMQALIGRPYYQSRAGWEGLRRDHRYGGWAAYEQSEVAMQIPQIVEADARHRLIELALAAEAYRVKTGKLPDQLDALVPAYLPLIPTDPFTGTPLRAKRDGNALVLYSVGRNGNDDGGAAGGKGPQPRPDDVTFRLIDR